MILDEVAAWAEASVGPSNSVARRISAAAVATHGVVSEEFPGYREVNPTDYPPRAMAASEALGMARGVKQAMQEGNIADAVSFSLHLAVLLSELGFGPRLIAKRRSDEGSRIAGKKPKKGRGLEAATRALVDEHGDGQPASKLWKESATWASDDPFMHEGFDVYRDGDKLVEVAPDGRERAIGYEAFRRDYVRPLKKKSGK